MAEASTSTPAPGPSNGDESARREALRKAGAEYFDKVLAKANAGKDPFVQPPKSKRKGDVEALDPDIETVGRVLEGVRLYVIGALYVAASAVSPVLIKASLQSLRTPGIQAFLHMLPVVVALWFLVDVTPLTVPVLKGVAPTTCLAAAQVLSVFGALLYCDVKLVLACITFLPQGLAVGQAVLQGRKLGVQQTLLLGMAGLGGLGLFLGTWPSFPGMLCLLCWASAEAGKVAWQACKAQLVVARPHLGEQAVQLLQSAAEEEAKLGSPALEFYQRALPAFPILLAGFVCREGRELVSHELSVPAVTIILLSVLAFACAAASWVLLGGAVTERTCALLQAAAALGTFVVIVAVSGMGAIGGTLLAALLVVGSAACLQLYPFLCP